MIKDYLILYRLFLKLSKMKEIKKEVNDFLPRPYDPNIVMADYRLDCGKSQENFDVEKLNDFSNTKSRFKDLNSGFLDFYDKNNIKVGAIEIGTLYGVDLFQSYLEVDKYVYEGMERLTNLQFDSITDLSKQVVEYKHTFWEGLSDKGIDKVAGHIGEVYAAEHLQQGGLSIQWPHTSNQTGWDLLVNGHEVNVKLVSDFHSLSQHFAQYPDIPVVIPGDAVNIPSDAIHFDPTHGIDQVVNAFSHGHDHLVFVDDALSNHDIVQHTENATSVLLGNYNMIDFHIPVGTIVFSGWREANLLLENKTNVQNSVKNIGLDTAGTGIGGFAGAKTGGVIGAAFGGPIGAGFGALIGGIGGAIFGRKITNEVKRAPLNNAIEDFNLADSELKAKITYESNKFNNEFKKVKNIEQGVMYRQQSIEGNGLKESIESIQKWRESQDNLTIEFANQLIDDSIEEIDLYIEQGNIKFKRADIIRSIFLPNIYDFSYDVIIKRLKKFKKKLISYKIKINRKKQVKRIELFANISKFGLQNNTIVELIIRAENERKLQERDIRIKIQDSQAKLVQCRVNSLKNLTNTLGQLKNNMRNNVKPYINKVNRLGNKVKIEAEKLGINQ